jgi:hypothetical protein
MRQAVERAFFELTGAHSTFNFSGWGGELTESERAAIEDRLPYPDMIIDECRAAINDSVEHLLQAERAKH